MSWWIWVLSGIGFLVVEIVTPGGLFALFFGVGAFSVAVLAALGVPATAQWLAFTVISLVTLATLRRSLQEKLYGGAAPAIDSIVGQQAVLLGDLPEGGEGQAELRGVPWTARLASGAPLRKGQRCRVERVEGVTLRVRGE